MSDNPFRPGDDIWAPDPFKTGSDPRLWLVLAAELLPCPGEEYVCAALPTSDIPDNHEVGDAWVRGKDPDATSYCSPWVLATIKHQAVADPQGRVTDKFLNRLVDDCEAYLGS